MCNTWRSSVWSRWMVAAAFLGVVSCRPPIVETKNATVAGRQVAFKVPAGWQERMRAAHSTELVKFAPTDSSNLVARSLVTTEDRASHEEAVRRLGEIAAEEAAAPTFSTIEGWPAIERRLVTTLPRVGGEERVKKPVAALETMTVRTVAVAVGPTVVRYETAIAPQASPALLDEFDVKRHFEITMKGDPERAKSSLDAIRGLTAKLRESLPLAPPPPARLAALPARAIDRSGTFTHSLGLGAPTTGAASVAAGNGELRWR